MSKWALWLGLMSISAMIVGISYAVEGKAVLCAISLLCCVYLYFGFKKEIQK